MNYLDLFSGIGGFTLGLQQAGLKFDWLGHSETDKYANQIYEKHYPESEALGDVRAIKIDRLPKIHLIAFGFPCQDLSIAGKRGGLRAKRSSLFFEAMRIVRDAKPYYFIFENVKGLFSSNRGYDWFTVLREIADSGYDGQWQLLNTRWFLPQNRERIYFVGHIRGRSRPKVFPIGESIEISSERINPDWSRRKSGRESFNALRGCGEMKTPMIQLGQLGEKDGMGQRVYSSDGIASTIRGEGGGQGGKTGLYMIQRSHGFNKGGKKELPSLRGSSMEQNDFIVAQAFDSLHGFGHGWQGYHNQKAINKGMIRRLTPIECERLQGFPDNWTEGISDTQRYKCLGNACSVPVVRAVGERLF